MEGGAKDGQSWEAAQAAWYQYYQQNPDAQAQYMAQWQQMAQYYGYDAANNWNRGVSNSGASSSYGGDRSYGGGGYGDGGQRRERTQPSNTLWVGNLTPAIREEDVRRAFESFGPIEHIKMLEAKNCAFVTFVNLESSKNAHASTYGLRINGVEVKINWGRLNERPQGPRGPQDGYGGGGYGGNNYGGGGYGGPGGYGQSGGYNDRFSGNRDNFDGGRRDDAHVTPSPNIWIGNLDSNIPEHEIRAAFERFGPIERVKMLPLKNCAFVNFVELNSALAAKAEMNGYMFFGQPLKVNFGKPRTPGFREQGQDGFERGPGGHQPRGSPYRPDDRGNASGPYPPGPRDETNGRPQYPVPTAVSIPLAEPTNVSEDVRSRTDKLVEAFKKNPDLEAMTKQNNATNPNFSFLFPGGEGHEYYLWKRFGSEVVSSAASAPAAPKSVTFVPKLAADSEPLSANEAEDFEGILRTLSPSDEKIKSAAEFVAEHASKADALSNALFDYAFNKISPTQNPLHFVFLINEIFNVTSRAKAAPDADPESPVLGLVKPFLAHLAKLMNVSNTEEQKKVLLDILARWKKQNTLNDEELASISADFEGSDSKKRKREDSDPTEESDTKRNFTGDN